MTNYQNLITHICGDACKGRKQSVKCFKCDRNFFLKCFGIDPTLNLKLNNAESFISFICGQCRTRGKRKSLSSNESSSTFSKETNHLNDKLSAPPPPPPVDINQLNDNIKALIDKLSVSPPPTPATPSTTSRDCDKSPETQNESNIKTTIDNMYSLIIKSYDKINKLHSSADEKESIRKLTNLFEKVTRDTEYIMPNKLSDALDTSNWSMQIDQFNTTSGGLTGRPSLIMKQSIDDDTLNILKNFESRTWYALDQIINNLKSQDTKLDALISADVCDELTN